MKRLVNILMVAALSAGLLLLPGCSLTVTIDKPQTTVTDSKVSTGDIDAGTNSSSDAKGDPSFNIDAGGMVK